MGSESSMISLMPGQSVTHEMRLSKNREVGKETFRVGFMLSQVTPVVWSSPLSVHFKDPAILYSGEPLPVEDFHYDEKCFTIWDKHSLRDPVNGEKYQNKIVVNSMQELTKLLKNKAVSGRDCAIEKKNAYDKCLSYACRVGDHLNNEDSRLACAKNICESSLSRENMTCLAEQSCLSKNLPAIDFNKKTLLGFLTSGSCATTGFRQSLLKDKKAKKINLVVETLSGRIPCSGPGRRSWNWSIIPKVPPDYTVIFTNKNF